MIPRVGILGAGNISDTHARAAAAVPDGRVVAVCGQNEQKARDLASRFGATAYTDVAAFLRHRPMNIVAIGSPSGLHGAQAVAAAAQGLHLLIEKPLEISVARATEVIDAAETAGVQAAICFQDRANPRLAAVKQAIANRLIGRPLLVNARVRWYRPPEYYARSRWRGTWELDGGGALMNQGVHTVDLLLWWLGDVVRVSARTATLQHQIEVEDTAIAWLEFANGALGTLEATTAAYPGYPRRVEVTGSEGTIVVEHDRVVACDVRDPASHDAAAALLDSSGADTNRSSDSPVVSDAAGHQRLLQDLIDAIATGRPPLCDAREGRRSVALVEAIYESARFGGRTVDVRRE